MGGKVEVTTGELVEGGCSLGGESPEARARSAGGLYLAPMLCSASSSLALRTEEASEEEGGMVGRGQEGKEDAPFGICGRGGRRRGLARGHTGERVVVGGERHEAVRCWIRYYLMDLRGEQVAREQARSGEG